MVNVPCSDSFIEMGLDLEGYGDFMNNFKELEKMKHFTGFTYYRVWTILEIFHSDKKKKVGFVESRIKSELEDEIEEPWRYPTAFRYYENYEVYRIKFPEKTMQNYAEDSN